MQATCHARGFFLLLRARAKENMTANARRTDAAANAIGARRWAIPEGGAGRAFESHETACILNASDRDVHVEITVYFADREPVGPYRLIVGSRRTHHLRFNDLTDPAPIPRDTDFASESRSDIPVVVQHTRLDSRQAESVC
jgi:hypothetical protein